MKHDTLTALATEVGAKLKQRGWMMATAESCTGGWVGQEMTAIAGSSDYFDRGFITYSNAAKQDMLGVSATTLEKFGAVSEETAREMAAGALAHRMRNHAGELLVVSDEGDESLSEQGAGLLDTLADMSVRGWATRKVVVRKLVQGVRTLEDGSLKFLRR